ncbi:MAG: hypothetical protein JWQ38_3480 [Flavipsychrobacter sp.]|nr:hypothetical protein [Flavipsychrobacter sp.]
MMSCFSDIGGIRSLDGGDSWSYTASGMSVNSVYRVTETPGGTMFAGTSGIHDMYQSTRLKDAQLDAADANGKIFYSANGGANWTMLHSFGHPVFWLAIDPNDTNTMYASVINNAGSGSAGGVWRTSNLNALTGSTWTQLAAPPRTEGHPASLIVLNDGKLLCTYSGRISSGSTFTASSGVFLYDPAGGTWSDVSAVNMHYWTKDVVLDPSDPTQNTWYVCVFTNWGTTASGQGGLYKTTNRGGVWTKLTGTTFDRVTSITFDPLNNNKAYLTTETQGLFMSNDMNLATPSWSPVTSYKFRQPERVYFNPFNKSEMWVSSFGNGMKVSNYAATQAPVNFNPVQQLRVYPNPVKDMLTITLPASHEAAVIQVYNVAGQLVKSIIPSKTNNTLLNTTTLIPGVYVVRCGDLSARFIKE